MTTIAIKEFAGDPQPKGNESTITPPPALRQHTPGPWACRPFIHEGRVVVYDIIGPQSEAFPSGARIGHVSYVEEHNDCHVVGQAEAGANAVLIAAAPKLLAALNELQANPNDPRAHRTALDAIALATRSPA